VLQNMNRKNEGKQLPYRAQERAKAADRLENKGPKKGDPGLGQGQSGTNVVDLAIDLGGGIS
jgi:hypothetical protein